MSPSSDTNIVGDDITTSATPTFTGTISEPDPNLVPLAGQTAILNVGIALDVNGTIEDFFDPSQLPANLSSYAQYIRQDAGTGLTDANGNFSVTVGIDAANTGLVTDTNPLPDLFPIYNVGSDGLLSPLPGDDSGYYVAQVIAQDQSGNQSTPNDINPSYRSWSTTRPRPPSSPAQRRPGHHVAAQRWRCSSDHHEQEHRPDPFHGRLDPASPAPDPTASWARPTM